MIEVKTVEAIKKELYACYVAAHRNVPDNTLTIVAQSIADALPGLTAENARDVFRRAKQVEAIPTVPGLATALKNCVAESYGDAGDDGTKAVEYKDPRAAWLPKNPVMRSINEMESVKNYCIACGGNAYWRLCEAKSMGKEAFGAFMAQAKAVVARLYAKYYRSCPIANGYPANAPVSLQLIPATVEDFRRMFEIEAAGHV